MGPKHVGRNDVGRSDVERSDVGRSDIGRSDIGRSGLDRRDSRRSAQDSAGRTTRAAHAEHVCESSKQLAEPPDNDGPREDSELALLRGGSPSQSDAPSRAHWRQILSGASPREVLGRLMSGDPLRIRALVSSKLAERAYLCDADRVFLRATARASRFAVRYRGQPDIDEWLAGIVDEALLDLLREDLEADRAGGEPDPADIAACVDLARPLGLDPRTMRSVCSAFNHLPDGERRAFQALVIDGRALDDVARASSQSATEIARAARRALDALLEVHRERSAQSAGDQEGNR